jgi:hypothetical protein
MCEPYLLREAIKFVHTINVNALTYKLTYLHTRFPDRDFLMCATSLCPDIKVILFIEFIMLIASQIITYL